MLHKVSNSDATLQVNFPGLYVFNAHPEVSKFHSFFKGRYDKFSLFLRYSALDFNVWDQDKKGIQYTAIRILQRICNAKTFDNTVMLVVLLNTIVMILNGLYETIGIDDKVDV